MCKRPNVQSKQLALDGAMVCRLRDGQWEIAASHLPHPDLGIHFDPVALNELQTSSTTLFHGTTPTKIQSAQVTVVYRSRCKSSIDVTRHRH